MLAELSLVAAGFLFSIHTDPMTDDVTYIAQQGSNDAAHISIECGALTNGALAIRINPDRYLYDAPFGAYNVLLRFDEGEASRVLAKYNPEDVWITGRDARRLASEMRSSTRLRIQMAGDQGESFVMDIPLSGDKSAIEHVANSCKRR